MTLPPHRHSSVCWDDGGRLWIHWERRKHKPDRSLISVACECATAGFAFCAPCSLRDYVTQRSITIGAAIFPEATPHRSISVHRQAFSLLGLPAPEAWTWKCVRAGKATEMAKTPGVSLAAVMAAGEWRSRAVLAYIHPEAVEPLEAIAAAIQDSEPEDC